MKNMRNNTQFEQDVDDKYVAFLDILGFKNYVYSHSQEEVKNYILKFSKVVYNQWLQFKMDRKMYSNITDTSGKLSVKGLLVSDSLVLHTKDNSEEQLKLLIEFIKEVCKASFNEKILFRCGIAKGEYNDKDMDSPQGLEKEVFYGRAYIDAYQLESYSQVSAMIVDKLTKDDSIKYRISEKEEFIEVNTQGNGELKKCYILPWMSQDFFKDNNNIEKYCKLALRAEWMPIYYNTIWSAVAKDSKLAREIFSKIRNYYYDGSKNQWINIGMFIGNSRAEKVFRECTYVVQSLSVLPMKYDSGSNEDVIDFGKF